MLERGVGGVRLVEPLAQLRRLLARGAEPREEPPAGELLEQRQQLQADAVPLVGWLRVRGVLPPALAQRAQVRGQLLLAHAEQRPHEPARAPLHPSQVAEVAATERL